jgi:hypothetical protein
VRAWRRSIVRFVVECELCGIESGDARATQRRPDQACGGNWTMRAAAAGPRTAAAGSCGRQPDHAAADPARHFAVRRRIGPGSRGSGFQLDVTLVAPARLRRWAARRWQPASDRTASKAVIELLAAFSSSGRGDRRRPLRPDFGRPLIVYQRSSAALRAAVDRPAELPSALSTVVRRPPATHPVRWSAPDAFATPALARLAAAGSWRPDRAGA